MIYNQSAVMAIQYSLTNRTFPRVMQMSMLIYMQVKQGKTPLPTDADAGVDINAVKIEGETPLPPLRLNPYATE